MDCREQDCEVEGGSRQCPVEQERVKHLRSDDQGFFEAEDLDGAMAVVHEIV